MSKNRLFTADEIISQISRLNVMFRKAQAAFPHYTTLSIHDFTSLVEAVVNDWSAHFQTQNFIIRLFSILQYFGVYNNFNENKYPELSVLKDLRNKFGHSLGNYNNENSKDRRTMRKIIKTFNLEDKEYYEFPISNDTIITQIVNTAIQYIKEHYP